VALPSRLPNRGEEAGNSASPPHARGASSPTSVARVEFSPRGVSPRCIMTGRHTCKASLKARFGAGVCRTSTFATVCTADIASPRCSFGFRQLFCLTKPRVPTALIEPWGASGPWCGICAQRARRSPRFFGPSGAASSSPSGAAADRIRIGASIHCEAQRRSFAFKIKFRVALRPDLTNESHLARDQKSRPPVT
jgi:hypothetical protein